MKLIDLDLYTDKQKLLFFVSLLVILVGTIYFLFNLQSSKIEYSKIKPSDFILNYEIQNDRETYWILEDIVSGFIGSSLVEKTSGNEISYIDYYNALDSGYQKYLGKSKYKKLANSFFDKFRVNLSDGTFDGTVKTTGLIESFYKNPNDDKYICKLNTVTGETYGYIGIDLNTAKKTYTIFYIN